MASVGYIIRGAVHPHTNRRAKLLAGLTFAGLFAALGMQALPAARQPAGPVQHAVPRAAAIDELFRQWDTPNTPGAAVLACAVGVDGQQTPATSAAQPPPAGFTALYNGRDLSGWRGGDTVDHRKLLEMTDAERTAQIDKWNATMRAHWTAQGEELVNDRQVQIRKR